MAKLTKKTAWFCSECGAESPKWQGKCPACGAWNTMVEETVTPAPSAASSRRPRVGLVGKAGEGKPRLIREIESGHEKRISLPSGELNRVLGGGLVEGSIVLLGGEPGIGKSTLVLQNVLSIRSRTVLYVSGEESASQIRMRADRIGRPGEKLFILCETSLESILEAIEQMQPGLVIIDSIQTIASDMLDSAPGSVSQVRECAASLLRMAKTAGIPMILIGHITKEGSIAGPKVLEHIVDAVVQFEGDRDNIYRLLRPVKNRFGSTSELGIYEMCQGGLREVTDPSEMFRSRTEVTVDLSGISTGMTLEGARAFLVEVQALVSTAAYGTPQRSVTGFDAKRMNMLLAVMEKRVGFKLGAKDVFLNIAGGLKVADPALDLAVMSAILSSNVDIAIPPGVVVAGEVGLSGEVRPVARIEQRIREADRLGIETAIIPRRSLKGVDTSSFNLKIVEVSKAEEAFRTLFS